MFAEGLGNTVPARRPGETPQQYDERAHPLTNDLRRTGQSVKHDLGPLFSDRHDWPPLAQHFYEDTYSRASGRMS